MGKYLPIERLTYAGEVTIHIEAITHRVSRYGFLFDFRIIDDEDHEFPITEGDPETLYRLLMANSNCSVTLVKNTNKHNHYLVDYSTLEIDEAVVPLCTCCGMSLREASGGLICTNPECVGRSTSRLRHFFSVIPIFTETHDLSDFIDDCVVAEPIGIGIFAALSTLLSYGDVDGYEVPKNTLIEYLSRLRNICYSLNVSIDRYWIAELVEFIDALSIPGITGTEINDGTLLQRDRYEAGYVFTYLAEYIVSQGLDPTRTYSHDLTSLWSLIDTSVDYNEDPSKFRDVDGWD